MLFKCNGLVSTANRSREGREFRAGDFQFRLPFCNLYCIACAVESPLFRVRNASILPCVEASIHLHTSKHVQLLVAFQDHSSF